MVYLLHYISTRAHYSRLRSTIVPSVACQTTEVTLQISFSSFLQAGPCADHHLSIGYEPWLWLARKKKEPGEKEPSEKNKWNGQNSWARRRWTKLENLPHEVSWDHSHLWLSWSSSWKTIQRRQLGWMQCFIMLHIHGICPTIYLLLNLLQDCIWKLQIPWEKIPRQQTNSSCKWTPMCWHSCSSGDARELSYECRHSHRTACACKFRCRRPIEVTQGRT